MSVHPRVTECYRAPRRTLELLGSFRLLILLKEQLKAVILCRDSANKKIHCCLCSALKEQLKLIVITQVMPACLGCHLSLQGIEAGWAEHSWHFQEPGLIFQPQPKGTSSALPGAAGRAGTCVFSLPTTYRVTSALPFFTRK